MVGFILQSHQVVHQHIHRHSAYRQYHKAYQVVQQYIAVHSAHAFDHVHIEARLAFVRSHQRSQLAVVVPDERDIISVSLYRYIRQLGNVCHFVAFHAVVAEGVADYAALRIRQECVALFGVASACYLCQLVKIEIYTEAADIFSCFCIVHTLCESDAVLSCLFIVVRR